MTELNGTIATLDRQLREKLLLPLLTEHASQGSAYVALSGAVEFYVGKTVPGYVPFLRCPDLLLALCEPLSAPANRLPLAEEFVAAGREAGVPVGFFPVNGNFLSQLARLGMRGIAAGVEPVCFLDGFSLAAPRWRKLRHAVRRGVQDGLDCHLRFGAELEPVVWGDLERVRSAWAARRVEGKPQPFLVAEPMAGREVKKFAIASVEERVVAFASLVPIPARNGWMVEGLFRAPEAPPGSSECLLAMCLSELGDEGFSSLALGPSLLAVPPSDDVDDESEADSVISNDVFRWLYAHAPELLNYRSAHDFKLKLNPDRIEALYFAFPQETPDARLLEAFLEAVFQGIELSGLVAELWQRLAHEPTARTLLPND